jgi:catechol 2,3-dioxygenase-like lactoylglutathione lyase family enzyme
MKQSIHQVALVVRDYDEALDFYVGTLGFTTLEDTYIPEQDKRWVVGGPAQCRGVAPAARAGGW